MLSEGTFKGGRISILYSIAIAPCLDIILERNPRIDSGYI